MKIQSLSVVVPNKVCMNHCASCPSRMHDDNYSLLMDYNLPLFDLYLKDYIKRLEFARDNGCNTVMLTGTSEPQQNRQFLTYFGLFMQIMRNPFRWIEMQTTGVSIDRDYLRFLRNHVGVNLISLSTFSLDDRENMDIIHPPVLKRVCLKSLAEDIVEYGFSLRMSLNLTSYFNRFAEEPEALFSLLQNTYYANQVTLRVLYASNNDTPEDKWVKENSANKHTIQSFKDYIKKTGKLLGVLPYGAEKYAVNNMSVVIDGDSMGKESVNSETYKYLILRPNCKLYSQWDDPASLIF